MSNEAVSSDSVNLEVHRPKLAWGADEIGRIIDRSPRQTHYLLRTGAITSAQKRGGRWVASVSALLREFGA
jgi:hypothetical protein